MSSTSAPSTSSSIQAAATAVQDYVVKHKKEVAIAAGATSVALLGAYAWRRAVRNHVPKSGPYPVSTLPEGEIKM